MPGEKNHIYEVLVNVEATHVYMDEKQVVKIHI